MLFAPLYPGDVNSNDLGFLPDAAFVELQFSQNGLESNGSMNGLPLFVPKMIFCSGGIITNSECLEVALCT